MVNIDAIVKLIDTIVVFFSASEREKRYKLDLKAKKDKALNLAEEMFELAESIFKSPPSNIRDSLIRKWEKLKRQFNVLD